MNKHFNESPIILEKSNRFSTKTIYGFLYPSSKVRPNLSSNLLIIRINILVNTFLVLDILGRTCFRDIGCFTASEYHDFSRRPIPLLPMAPEYIDPVFHIFTVKNTLIAQNFSYNSTSAQLKKSLFNPKHRTILITHGFRSGFEDWITVCFVLSSFGHFLII